jgi:hypothetical protein
MQHRHDEEAPVADGTRHLQARRGDAGIALEITHMDNSPVEDRLGHDARAAGRDRVHPSERLELRGREAVVLGDQVNEATVEPIHGR